MKQLPESEVYEDGLAYWPYKKSLKVVLDYIVKYAPRNASLLDMMCGPAYLLGEIAKERRDLALWGVDIDERYIKYGRTAYPHIVFEQGNILKWRPESPFDVVICTGALHHVPYDQQESAVVGIVSMVKPRGLVIISDCYIDEYYSETQRKLSAAELGYEYLRATILNGAPDKVVEWTADILHNDVLMHEYKTSLEKRMPILAQEFSQVRTIKAWPETASGYGDYVHICVAA